MTIKDKYDLGLYKSIMQNGLRKPECFARLGTSFRVLANAINLLEIAECEDIICEIESAEEGKHFERYVSNDWVAIEIKPPNILIDNEITIPMNDMKELLKEWLEFAKPVN